MTNQVLPPKEVITRSIIAVDRDGRVYTINQINLNGDVRYALYNDSEVKQISDQLFQIVESGVDLRTIY